MSYILETDSIFFIENSKDPRYSAERSRAPYNILADPMGTADSTLGTTDLVQHGHRLNVDVCVDNSELVQGDVSIDRLVLFQDNILNATS